MRSEVNSSFRRKPESTFFEAAARDSLVFGSRGGAEAQRVRDFHEPQHGQARTDVPDRSASLRLLASARTKLLTGRWGGVFGFALILAGPAQAAEPTTYQRAIAAGYKAAMLCSGIFNAGRTEAQIEADELRGIYPEYDPILPTLKADVVRGLWRVYVQFDPELPPRIAAWSPEKGCSNFPIGWKIPVMDELLQPVPKIALADNRAWPLGDARVRPLPSATLAHVIATSFDGKSYGTDTKTVGVVVVRDGRIDAERYGPGFGAFVSNRTWSVAKSISGTLIGIASGRGLLNVHQGAKIPEWGNWTVDPRAQVTLDNLLRMASGLHSDSAGNRTDAIYFGGTAVTEQTTGWPLEAQPGGRFRYANNDILLAIRSLRAALNDDKQYVLFPRKMLFDKIGMAHTVA